MGFVEFLPHKRAHLTETFPQQPNPMALCKRDQSHLAGVEPSAKLRRLYLESEKRSAGAFALNLQRVNPNELLLKEVQKLLEDLGQVEMQGAWSLILREEWVKRGATDEQDFERVKAKFISALGEVQAECECHSTDEWRGRRLCNLVKRVRDMTRLFSRVNESRIAGVNDLCEEEDSDYEEEAEKEKAVHALGTSLVARAKLMVEIAKRAADLTP